MKKDILGRGGQGIVYGCLWKNKNTAVKEIYLEGNKEVANDLFKELQIMVEKKSDKIVEIFGYSLYTYEEEL
jgi:hypothetical protein